MRPRRGESAPAIEGMSAHAADAPDAPTEAPNGNMDRLLLVIYDFLTSKSLIDAEVALRREVQQLFERGDVSTFNHYTSDLERELNLIVGGHPTAVAALQDVTPVPVSALEADEGTVESIHDLSLLDQPISHDKLRPLALIECLRLPEDEARECRQRRGTRSVVDAVVFHEPEQMSPKQKRELVTIQLPICFNNNINGLEEAPEFAILSGSFVAGRYRTIKAAARGSFSKFYQCVDHGVAVATGRRPRVGVKILKNTKDGFDTGLLEVRMLARIRERDPSNQHHLLRIISFCYWREHLVIVTELLHISLFAAYRKFATSHERLRFFNARTMATLSSHVLDALAFLHELGITHADVKPENICLVLTEPCAFKLIDLGSAVLRHDLLNSYIQSRWYRAPEIMLGVPWGDKVDIWSLGCTLVEPLLGRPIFRHGSTEGVLAAQMAVLGPLPEYMRLHSPGLANMFITAGGHAYEVDPPQMTTGVYICEPLPLRSLEHLLIEEMTPELFAASELNGFVNLVSQMLVLDPAHRTNAAQSLQHPWLAQTALQSSPLAVLSPSSLDERC